MRLPVLRSRWVREGRRKTAGGEGTRAEQLQVSRGRWAPEQPGQPKEIGKQGKANAGEQGN